MSTIDDGANGWSEFLSEYVIGDDVWNLAYATIKFALKKRPAEERQVHCNKLTALLCDNLKAFQKPSSEPPIAQRPSSESSRLPEAGAGDDAYPASLDLTPDTDVLQTVTTLHKKLSEQIAAGSTSVPKEPQVVVDVLRALRDLPQLPGSVLLKVPITKVVRELKKAQHGQVCALAREVAKQLREAWEASAQHEGSAQTPRELAGCNADAALPSSKSSSAGLDVSNPTHNIECSKETTKESASKQTAAGGVLLEWTDDFDAPGCAALTAIDMLAMQGDGQAATIPERARGAAPQEEMMKRTAKPLDLRRGIDTESPPRKGVDGRGTSPEPQRFTKEMQDKLKSSTEHLRQRYQQESAAKNMRTIQVVDHIPGGISRCSVGLAKRFSRARTHPDLASHQARFKAIRTHHHPADARRRSPACADDVRHASHPNSGCSVALGTFLTRKNSPSRYCI
ncbi:hypothetical protein CYMTET_20383 [Cymbomonas tetramitiformis]|uniref:TFIIS N-terminal domain-containing protein n=1 Tax=Cymbomonas tetramitiformis TaxID=36881 RepID=A0AAE0G4D9_9CHLO|nr:hypothetical protein CYMTET_20383 [Cymbomonas tetramitiformis]